MTPYYQDDLITLYHDKMENIVPNLSEIGIVLTSPPYYNQRSYSNWNSYQSYISTVERWVSPLYSILNPGRHCIWVIPDKIPIPPKENGTKERLYEMVYADTESIAKKTGFIPEFPIIWDKRGPNLTEQPWSKKMWGSYPYPISIIHTQFTERICIWRKPGHHNLSQKDREKDKITAKIFNDWARDIWSIRVSSDKSHPATFPKEIPLRILTLWSYSEDTILDPFAGSGTTLIVAKSLNRKAIGVEKEEKYCEIAANNLEKPTLI